VSCGTSSLMACGHPARVLVSRIQIDEAMYIQKLRLKVLSLFLSALFKDLEAYAIGCPCNRHPPSPSDQEYTNKTTFLLGSKQL